MISIFEVGDSLFVYSFPNPESTKQRINDHGLTLIEVLLSLVILATFFCVSSELFHMSVDSLDRIQAEAQMATALPNIRAIISDFDLSEKGRGTAQWGKISFTWKAQILKSARNQTNPPDLESAGPPGPGRFLMKLYEIQLTLTCTTQTREISRQYTLLETQYQAVE